MNFILKYKKKIQIVKKKLKYYLFSDFVKENRLKKKFHINSQANWKGETLSKEVPNDVRDFFKKSSLTAKVLTIGGLTKNTCFIKNYSKIYCDELDLSKENIHLSIWSEFWDKDSKLTIKINDDSFEFKNIKNINNPTYTNDTWFDISLKIKNKFEYIEVFCGNEEIYFAKPITYNSIKSLNKMNKNQSNHVVLIILDGVVAEYFNNDEKKTIDHIKFSSGIDTFFFNQFNTKYAFSTCEWTLPGISSFFSGMYTSQHRISKPIGYNFYNDNLPSLPFTLNQNGYKTQFFSTGNRTTPLFGFNKGFDRIFYSHPHGITKSKFRTHDWINNAIDFLNVYQNDKTFSYIHFPNTHQDWMTPGFQNLSFSLLRDDKLGFDLSTIEENEAEKIEKIRIYELDLFLEALFNFIEKKISNNTTVILTGDHGSPFYKKYSKKGKVTSFAEEIPVLNFKRTNVPFYCRTPNNIYKSKDISKMQLVSSNIDIAPTILDVCKINKMNFTNGNSIFDEKKRDFIVSESIYKDLMEIAIISKEYSYFERFKFDQKKFQIIDRKESLKMLYETKNDYKENLIDKISTDKFKNILNLHIQDKFKN